MIKVEKVLIPVDGSDSSRNAAKYGTQLVNARNPKIYLLNVWEPINMTIGGEMAEKLRLSAQAKSKPCLRNTRRCSSPAAWRSNSSRAAAVRTTSS